MLYIVMPIVLIIAIGVGIKLTLLMDKKLSDQ